MRHEKILQDIEQYLKELVERETKHELHDDLIRITSFLMQVQREINYYRELNG